MDSLQLSCTARAIRCAAKSKYFGRHVENTGGATQAPPVSFSIN
jgi:hypothetical protein